MKTDLERSGLNLSLWSAILQLNSAPLLKVKVVIPNSTFRLAFRKATLSLINCYNS